MQSKKQLGRVAFLLSYSNGNATVYPVVVINSSAYANIQQSANG
jgi:hypothetical protein